MHTAKPISKTRGESVRGKRKKQNTTRMGLKKQSPQKKTLGGVDPLDRSRLTGGMGRK